MIGVLALQGNFDAHIKVIKKLNLDYRLVNKSKDLDCLDGLVFPGGESRTITKLFKKNDNLIDAIKDFSNYKPILGTCAGIILMSKQANDERVYNFGFLDVIMQRNAYGRQVHSFEGKISVNYLDSSKDAKALFIRAPKIKEIGKDVEVFATYKNEVVGVKQGMHVGITCHPELLNETLIHNICFNKK